MKIEIERILVALGSVLLLSGCITHEETVYRDVDRNKVEFASDTAARIFYEALSKPPPGGTPTESKTEVDVPVVFHHKRKVVAGPNVRFNEAVAECDTDRDGKITEFEAKVFAEHREKQ